jgi:hypothetical protein
MPDYAVNLDIFGYGDSIFATSSNTAGSIVKVIQQAGTDTNFLFVSFPHRSIHPAIIAT